MTKPVIDIQKLSFSYENDPILKELSFSVDPNDFFIIIGPNGSGKSTLLKIISGIITPGSGQVAVKGIP